MIQKYFKCEICGVFIAIARKGRASRYCSRSCRSKAFYQRKKMRQTE